MNQSKILLLDILTDNGQIRSEYDKVFQPYGGYGCLINRCLGESVRLDVLNAGFCDPSDLLSTSRRVVEKFWDGIIVGSSVTSISHRGIDTGWQTQILSIIRQAVDNQIPILGIAGGCQYGAVAIRGLNHTVVMNPHGPNRETYGLFINASGKKHPIFDGRGEFPPVVQWNHLYIVNELPAGSSLLASNPKVTNAAFQCGSFIGVQWQADFGTLKETFFGAKIMGEIIDMYIREAGSPLEIDELVKIRGEIVPASGCGNIFANWVNMIRTGFFR